MITTPTVSGKPGQAPTGLSCDLYPLIGSHSTWTDPRGPVTGIPEKQTHDYIRHGTTTQFATLEIATGKVTEACYPRHRHEEFGKFLRQVASAYPRVPLHIVADNYGTHKHPGVTAWLAKNPRITLHFTPTFASRLNMADRLLDHHPPGHPPRQLYQRQRPHQRDRSPSLMAGTTAVSPSPGPRHPTS